jgi:drug/metabolite transporter (DMT)-like permease
VKSRPYAVLFLAVACVSVGSIFVRLAQAPALGVAFYRIFLASLVVAPVGLRPLFASWPALRGGERLALLGSGVSLGLHFATWIASLSYTTVAASVLLVNTAPLFTLAFSRVFLGETVSGVVKAALTLALGGAGLIAIGDWSQGAGSLMGDGLAVAGAATLSAYHVVGRGLRDALPLSAYVVAVWGTAALVLLLLVWAARVPLAPYPPRTWLAFLGLALVPTVFGHGLVNRSLRHFPAPTVGLFLLGEPVAAAILAYAILAERPATWTLAGGALVLAALVVVARKEEP